MVGAYRYIQLLFVGCLLITLGMSVCEVAVRDIEGDSYYDYKKINHSQNL